MLLNQFKNHYLKNEKIYIWGLVIFFFLFRIAYLGFFGITDNTTLRGTDGYRFNEYAKVILHNSDWLSSKDFYASYIEPGYPIFVALVYTVFGVENFWAVYIIQALLSALMLFLIYKLAFIVVRRRLVALMSMLWAGFYSFYFVWIGTTQREVLNQFLLILLFYSLALLFQRINVKAKHIIIPALIFTLLIHTDGRYAFYGPFLVILFLLYRRPILTAIKQYILFGLMVIILTVPWTYRNYLAYKEVIVINEYTLNLSSSDLTPRQYIFNFAPIDSLYSSPYSAVINDNYPTEQERSLIMNGQNPNNRSLAEIKMIREGKRAAKTWLGRKWYEFQTMWFPFIFGNRYAPYPVGLIEKPFSLQHNILSILQYLPLIPFALLAIINGCIKRKRAFALLGIPIAIHMLLHILTYGLFRYRIPIESFIIILGCTGVVIVMDAIQHKVKITKQLD